MNKYMEIAKNAAENGIKLNEGYKCIESIIGVTKDYNFKLITEKGREKEFMLDDIVSSENERRLFDYMWFF